MYFDEGVHSFESLGTLDGWFSIVFFTSFFTLVGYGTFRFFNNKVKLSTTFSYVLSAILALPIYILLFSLVYWLVKG